MAANLHPGTPRAAWLRRGARRLMFEGHVERGLAAIDPLWSLDAPRARVVAVVDETPDVKTLVLHPNRHWSGYRAGQYTLVEVEIDGVRRQRCYSLSSAPCESELAITVKRVPDGVVSSWLHDLVRPGDVLGLGPACGEFVLPEPVPERLLFYTGGSGITPAMSILRDLDRRGAIRDVVFLHHARSRRDVIFGDQLAVLDTRHDGLRVELRLDDEVEPGARSDLRAWLARVVPDFGTRTTYLCGPAGLMSAVETARQRAGATGLLVREQFAPAAAPSSSPSDVAPVSIALTRSRRSLVVPRTKTLLRALEAAGERPRSGCRMGICNTCVCRKRAGAVRNVATGIISRQPNEDIRLCVSTPMSDELELEL